MNEPMSDERLADQFATPFEAAEQILARCRKYRRAEVADVEILAGLVSGLVLSEAADAREVELLDATTRAETAERKLAEYRQTIAELRAELAGARESHQLSEAQLVEVTLERAEWRKQAQRHETVAKSLRANLILTETALAELQAQAKDDAGWTAAENAEFEKLYGVRTAMRLRAANDRVWQIVQELRTAAVEAGRDPYQDPMAQRLSAALVGVEKVVGDGQ